MSSDQSHVNSFDKFELKNVSQDFMNNESLLIEINKLIDTLKMLLTHKTLMMFIQVGVIHVL